LQLSKSTDSQQSVTSGDAANKHTPRHCQPTVCTWQQTDFLRGANHRRMGNGRRTRKGGSRRSDPACIYLARGRQPLPLTATTLPPAGDILNSTRASEGRGKQQRGRARSLPCCSLCVCWSHAFVGRRRILPLHLHGFTYLVPVVPFGCPSHFSPASPLPACAFIRFCHRAPLLCSFAQQHTRTHTRNGSLASCLLLNPAFGHIDLFLAHTAPLTLLSALSFLFSYSYLSL
jgi:hypothetical protein